MLKEYKQNNDVDSSSHVFIHGHEQRTAQKAEVVRCFLATVMVNKDEYIMRYNTHVMWPVIKTRNSSEDETANGNFLRRYRTRTTKYENYTF